jgi:hypothetical protein
VTFVGWRSRETDALFFLAESMERSVCGTPRKATRLGECGGTEVKSTASTFHGTEDSDCQAALMELSFCGISSAGLRYVGSAVTCYRSALSLFHRTARKQRPAAPTERFESGACPPRSALDPADRRLPPSRLSGVEPSKRQTTISPFGSSIDGMRPVFYMRGTTEFWHLSMG